MDKFLLAENPMASNTLAIVHMLHPISILTVHEGHINTKYPHQQYTYRNGDGIQEEYTLSLYHCFSTSFDGEVNSPMVMKLFKDAWHWYMAYLNWEDQNIANEQE
jgi:hypothetical protein